MPIERRRAAADGTALCDALGRAELVGSKPDEDEDEGEGVAPEEALRQASKQRPVAEDELLQRQCDGGREHHERGTTLLNHKEAEEVGGEVDHAVHPEDRRAAAVRTQRALVHVAALHFIRPANDAARAVAKEVGQLGERRVRAGYERLERIDHPAPARIEANERVTDRDR